MAMRVQQAIKQAAQGDRLTQMAERGMAWNDEIDDLRVADSRALNVFNLHTRDKIGARMQELARWIEIAFHGFEEGRLDINIPDNVRAVLRDIGEELRDSAESELDRLALSHLKRVLRRRVVKQRDRWALRRVVQLVESEGFRLLGHESSALHAIGRFLNADAGPSEIDSAAEHGIRRVLREFPN
jgi:hypothetical protein